MMSVSRVQICSPYKGNIEFNVELAKRLCKMAIAEGKAPFAPHLLYPQMLNEDNPEERALGLHLAVLMMRGMQELWVCSNYGISEGMGIEIQQAQMMGLPIRYVRDPLIEESELAKARRLPA